MAAITRDQVTSLTDPGPERSRVARRRALGRSPGEPRKIAYLYILPTFLFYGALVLFPFGQCIWISLFDWDGLSVASWVGLGNYQELFTDPQLRSSFLHAGVLIVFFAVIPIATALLLAATLSRKARLRGRTFFRTVLFLPQVIASVVVATTWSAIYSPDGMLNFLLRHVGLGALARPWLGDYGLALPAVGVIGAWVGVGGFLVMFMAGAQQISTDLYDAARVDGAGPLREFFAVTLPGLRGQLVVASTLGIIGALRTFDLVYVTTHGGPGTSTSVPAYEVYHRAFVTNEVGSACAIAITLAVLIFIVTLLVNRLDKED
jgi:raffinose/stachyose/melibiose transport system permease protein